MGKERFKIFARGERKLGYIKTQKAERQTQHARSANSSLTQKPNAKLHYAVLGLGELGNAAVVVNIRKSLCRKKGTTRRR